MDESNSTRIFEHVSNIRLLEINGCFSNLNLDSLVNLENLTLNGEIKEGFNYDLFKNFCDNLQKLYTYLKFDDDEITKLFDSYNFPRLLGLNIRESKITKLEKKFFQRFPMLHTFNFAHNCELKIIENDAFSSLSNLVHLKLNDNLIEKIDRTHFSSLINLEILNLKDNKIKSLEENIFSELTKLKNLNLANNRIESIGENTFSNLNNLTELDLSYNRLSELNPRSFFGLGNLKTLHLRNYLRNNKMNYFDLRIFDYIGKIERIALSFNSISNKDKILEKCKHSNIEIDLHLF